MAQTLPNEDSPRAQRYRCGQLSDKGSIDLVISKFMSYACEMKLDQKGESFTLLR